MQLIAVLTQLRLLSFPFPCFFYFALLSLLCKTLAASLFFFPVLSAGSILYSPPLPFVTHAYAVVEAVPDADGRLAVAEAGAFAALVRAVAALAGFLAGEPVADSFGAFFLSFSSFRRSS